MANAALRAEGREVEEEMAVEQFWVELIGARIDRAECKNAIENANLK